MERKITHYVVKPEHRRHLCRLLCLIDDNNGEHGQLSVENDASLIRILTEAKVLDLWCTPCYEKKKVKGRFGVWLDPKGEGYLLVSEGTKSFEYAGQPIGMIFIDQEIE